MTAEGSEGHSERGLCKVKLYQENSFAVFYYTV